MGLKCVNQFIIREEVMLMLFSLILLSSMAAPISRCMTKSNEVGQDLAYNCQIATHQGRRRYQEDRTVCARGMLTQGTGLNNTSVHIAAVFDGHNGAEASELASKLLLKYFSQHVNTLLTSTYSVSPSGLDARHATYDKISVASFQSSLPDTMHYPYVGKEASKSFLSRSVYMEILKESLKRTIYDIDSAFTKDALKQNWKSGSTAVIILIFGDEILAANLGDSKAILCSESAYLPRDVRADLASLRRRMRAYTKREERLKSLGEKCLLADEFTEEHHPDNDAERIRVEAAGGYVEEWAGVSRVNAQLAVSRSIGDVHFKRYGVISTPHVTEWRHISSIDRYLVLGSDGIFEKMTPQQVCNLLWVANLEGAEMMTAEGSSSSFADYIVDFAFRSGTTDNMSAIVIALASNAMRSI